MGGLLLVLLQAPLPRLQRVAHLLSAWLVGEASLVAANRKRGIETGA